MEHRAEAVAIRAMSVEDVPAAAAWEREIFGTEAWSEEDFFETLRLPYTTCLAAAESGKLLGLAILRNCSGEGYISNVWVSPLCRRRGIGRRLLGALLKAASGDITEGFVLEVRQGNIPAIRLYESFGFRPAGIRNGLYSDPVENGVIMKRDCFDPGEPEGL